jgi:(S)-2-hydroxyglutarate dehydrogenase
MAKVESFEAVVIGGGIVGVSTALSLVRRLPGLSVLVLEKEDRLARHQTGHNSGVIHSGLYYRPGTLKASNCVEGREELYKFCAENGLPHERCGKIVVAVEEKQLPALAELERRGRANGLEGLETLDAQQIREREPQAAGIAGLWVPQTGIVDFARVTETMAKRLREEGGELRLLAEVRRVRRQGGEFRLFTTSGEVRSRSLINCAGLYCDRVARLCGASPGVQIVPFRGEYYQLRRERRHLVRNLIYPVPDPEFPFLGVHFTRMIDGRVEAGPNAVMALRREGYGRLSFSPADSLGILTFPGFWRLARKYFRTGLREYHRSFSKKAFVRELSAFLPSLEADDLLRADSGVRAQAVTPEGKLVDDFHIVEGEGAIHVLNAPSPAATASLSIGRTVAERAEALLR